jgi:nucleoside diphosphate kinase
MCSDVTRAFIFTKETNDDEFKEASRIKDEIRKNWGESDMRNVVHSSDSLEHMKEESSIYFGYI